MALPPIRGAIPKTLRHRDKLPARGGKDGFTPARATLNLPAVFLWPCRSSFQRWVWIHQSALPRDRAIADAHLELLVSSRCSTGSFAKSLFYITTAQHLAFCASVSQTSNY